MSINIRHNWFLDSMKQGLQNTKSQIHYYNIRKNIDPHIVNSLVSAWLMDYENNEDGGIGPEFTLVLSSSKQMNSYCQGSNELDMFLMFEAAYRDHILDLINPNQYKEMADYYFARDCFFHNKTLGLNDWSDINNQANIFIRDWLQKWTQKA